MNEKRLVRLQVRYTAQLRTAVGRSEDDVELPEGSSLGELFHRLATEIRREAAAYLLTSDGRPQPSLLVAVNEGAVSMRDAHSVKVAAGDIVTLMPPVAGG